MECEFRVEKDDKLICTVASDISGLEAETNWKACEVCLKHELAKQLNPVTASMACNAVFKYEPERYDEIVQELHHHLRPEVSMSQKAVNYTKSTAEWILDGASVCTDEEVAARREICLKCEYYRPKNADSGYCGVCGCPVSMGGAFGNKLRRKTEKCPKEKW